LVGWFIARSGTRRNIKCGNVGVRLDAAGSTPTCKTGILCPFRKRRKDKKGHLISVRTPLHCRHFSSMSESEASLAKRAPLPRGAEPPKQLVLPKKSPSFSFSLSRPTSPLPYPPSANPSCSPGRTGGPESSHRRSSRLDRAASAGTTVRQSSSSSLPALLDFVLLRGPPPRRGRADSGGA
jgi:hypothetical protein